MSEIEGFAERFFSLRKSADMSQEEVGAALGLTKSGVSSFEKGKSIPSPENLVKLARLFKVSVDYLLTGQDVVSRGPELENADTPKTSDLHSGPRTKKYTHKGQVDYELPILSAEEQAIADRIEDAYQDGFSSGITAARKGQSPEPRIVAVAEGDNTGAPIYNLRTAANYRGLGLSQEHPEPDGVITLPSWLLRRGDHAVFPVIGDSMEPTFFAKDYVLCRFLPKEEWAHLREDTVAVVVSESRGLQLKRLSFRAGEEYVRCRSDNRQHPAYNLDLEEVFEVWRFEWRITANAHNPTEGLSERVSTVEDSLEDMRILLEQVLDRKDLRQLEARRD